MAERLSNESLENAISVQKSTVEACEELKDEDYCPALDNAVIAFLEELQQYRTIGTVQQCKEAVTKTEEMQLLPPRTSTFTYKGICPVCENEILISEKYCSQCGQKVGVGNGGLSHAESV